MEASTMNIKAKITYMYSRISKSCKIEASTINIKAKPTYMYSSNTKDAI